MTGTPAIPGALNIAAASLTSAMILGIGTVGQQSAQTTLGDIAAFVFSGGSGTPTGGTINVTPTTNPLVITSNSVLPPNYPTGTLLVLVAADGANSRLTIDSHGTGIAARYMGRRSRGTTIAPTAVQADDTLLSVTGLGYGSADYSSENNSARFLIVAAETWTDTSQATYMSWRVPSTGGILATERMRLQSTGNLTVGATTDDGLHAIQATGGIAALTGYISESTGNALTAVGTNRATSLALTNQINNITSAAAGTGVTLPAVSVVGVGTILMIFNAGANAMQVYGAGSDTIDGAAAATGVPLTNAKRCVYIAVAAATWVSAQLGVVSA